MTTASRTNDDLLRSLVAASPGGVYIVKDRTFRFTNERFDAWRGLISATGRESLSFVHPEDTERVRHCATQMLKGAELPPYDYRIVRSDGEIRWMRETVTSIVYEGGRASLGHCVDITAMKSIEERIRLLDQLMHLISGAPDVESGLKQALDAICRETGWAVGEAWIIDTDVLTYAASSAEAGSVLGRFAETSSRLTFGARQGLPGSVWAQKKPIWLENLQLAPVFTRKAEARQASLQSAVGVPVLAADEVIAVLQFFLLESRPEDGRAVDLVSELAARLGGIFKQKQAEDALRKSEERIRLILDTSHEAFISMDDSGQILQWNQQAVAIFGRTRAEVAGRSFAEIIPEAYRQELIQGIDQYLKTGEEPLTNNRWELAALRPDGELIPIELSLSPVTYNGTVTFNAFVRDVSERRRLDTELRATASDLRRKNEQNEAFIYSISHDLKEPLRALEGFSQILLASYRDGLDERGGDLLLRISNASVRMKHLIDDLLALSRASRDSTGKEVIRAEAIVEEVRRHFAAEIQRRGATLRVGDLPLVAADGARLELIFQNLIGNGLKFNKSSPPHLEVGVHETSETAVTLFVKDNGIGIEPRFHEKVLGLFQRLHTRDEFEGNGAGLAIVRTAVETLGGRLWIESAPGEGSTFFFSLPLPGHQGSSAVNHPRPEVSP